MHNPPLLPRSNHRRLLLGLLASSTAPLLVRSDAVPTAIRKMSLDDGEKLMPEYLAFAVPRQYPLAEAADYIGSSRSSFPPRGTNDDNDTSPAFQRPWSIHLLSPRDENNARDAQAAAAVAQRDVLQRLQGRQFSCPENTFACTNIGQSDYCCQKGTACFTVEGSPAAGNVGCCPDGENCKGSVGDCTGGSTACAANVGGGCCIPGYVCANVGCKCSLAEQSKSGE